MVSVAALPNLPKSLNIGIASVEPTTAPPNVDNLRCSAVAPLSSARPRASPAPAATPVPTAAIAPGIPRGAIAKKGSTDPTPSPSLRVTVSSYPGAAANGALIAPAISLVLARVAFSYSSGSIEEAPVTAPSTRPTAPGTTPLKNSLTLPVTVVSGAASPAFGSRAKICWITCS